MRYFTSFSDKVFMSVWDFAECFGGGLPRKVLPSGASGTVAWTYVGRLLVLCRGKLGLLLKKGGRQHPL